MYMINLSANGSTKLSGMAGGGPWQMVLGSSWSEIQLYI